MKVSELLDGALLDYWVARAAGMTHSPALREMQPGCTLVPYESDDSEGSITRYRAFEPSTNWADGGSIIEREGISIARWEIGFTVVWNASDRDRTAIVSGPTPLIAAMRRYVSSRFGEEVPDEVPA